MEKLTKQNFCPFVQAGEQIKLVKEKLVIKIVLRTQLAKWD